MADELNPIAPQAPATPPQAAPIAAAPAVQPTSPAPTAPTYNPQSVEGLGIDLSKLTTPQQVIDALAAQTRQQQAALRFVAGNMQQPTAQATPPPAAPEEWTPERHLASQWKLPAPDPQWAGLVNSGVVIQQDGEYVSANPANVWVEQFLPAMNNYEKDRRNYLHGYLENPLQKTYEAIKQPIEKLIEQQVKEGIKAAREQEKSEEFIQSWFKDNDKDLYAGVQNDPLTGRQTRVLSPWATQIQTYCNQLADNGVVDQAAQIRLAMQAIPKPAPPALIPAPPATPNPGALPFMAGIDARFNAAAFQPSGGSAPVANTVATGPLSKTFFADAARAMANGASH